MEIEFYMVVEEGIRAIVRATRPGEMIRLTLPGRKGGF
jgi:hypothetical protein